MKKILLNLFAIILAVSMVFTMAPLSMDHAYADDTTITIDGVKYTLNDDGTTATVSGHIDGLSGDVRIRSTITNNNQQYTVTSIGESAFNGCEDLETITIPKGVTSIGEYSFAGSGLTSVTFGEESNLTSIGSHAFEGCNKLESITIPKDVISVGESAFETSGLTSVTFAEGSNLTSIGSYAFEDCKSLTSIKIPKNVTSIGTRAFAGCEGLKSITIPKGVTSIEDSTFLGNIGLTSVTFAEGSNLTSIGTSAFLECNNLETITIPESVTSIGEGAFYSCANLEAINIPAGVESIGNYAFSGCAKISTVTIPASVTSMGENAFHGSGLTTVTFEEGSNLTIIEKDAFSACESLTTVTIPTSVTSIGESAFSGCRSLKTVTIPVGVQNIGTNAFANAPLETIYYFGTETQWKKIRGDDMPNATVYYIMVKNGVVYMGYTLNYSRKATVIGHTDGLSEEVSILSAVATGNNEDSYTVRSIGDNAFKDCGSLKTITIPRNVDYIGNGAFDGTSLTTVNYDGPEAWWDTIKGDGKPTNVTVIFFPIIIDGIQYEPYNDGTATVINYYSDPPADFEILSRVSDYNRQYTVTSIARETFKNCDSLESVSIPASVESIEESAFCGCTNLKTVAFEENSKLKSIAQDAFNGCGNLESVSIPASVESIGERAFYHCTGLLNITIPASVTSIQESAFVDCNALTTFNYLGPKAQWEALNADAGLQVQDGQDIIFKNSDGTELQYSSMKSGLTPQYLGATPTREADNQYTYTFAGWDPEITEVTGTATYTAKYDATRIPTESISIKGAKVALSAASFTYNGKVLKPSVKKVGGRVLKAGTDYTVTWSNASSKNIGTYSVTVTGKGKYKDTAKATYQIVPKGTVLKKPKKAKKAITVKWKKQTAKMPKARIGGYRIQLATNSAFTKGVKTVNVKGYKTASKKVKKLKGKTKYYVRICTYMKSGGKTYYSPWSAVKTVKTK